MSDDFGGCAATVTLDPFKRVHYSQGLVLGVDEFLQEQFRWLESERRHHRTLHGYGTVCGLGVSATDAAEGVEVRVEPGHALDAMGREVAVGTAQCALLDEWLAREAAGSPPLGSPGSPPVIEAWVTLCHRECRTDLEPIPGGPCRTPDESMTPTRVTETFRLALERAGPDRTELDALRAFARLVGRIEVTPTGAPDMPLESFVAEVEALAPGASPAPPVSPPISPPGGPIQVPEAEIESWIEAAMRAWVTRVRPTLQPAGRGCADGPAGEACIALARLEIPVRMTDAGAPVVDGDAAVVAVEEAGRPLLLHTQLIQELLVNGGATGAGAGVREHADLLGLAADDHLQYLRVAPRDSLPGGGPEDLSARDRLLRDLSGGGARRVRELPQAAAAGDALPSGNPAGGDLAGTLPNPRVEGLHGLPVPAPSDADVGRHLAVGRAGGRPAWELVDPPEAGGGEAGETELVRLQALSWRHGRRSDLGFTLRGLDGAARRAFGVAVAFGVARPGDARVLFGEMRDGRRGGAEGVSTSLDVWSFRLYTEVADFLFDLGPGSGGTWRRLRIAPVALRPVEPPDLGPEDRLFSSGTEVEEEFASAAFLEIAPQMASFILENRLPLWIELEGDHVVARDREGRPRAVDAEFLRGELPTGDRAAAAERGVQGGLFSSWIVEARPGGDDDDGRDDDVVVIDVNAADADALREAGVPAATARRIVEAREARGGFRDVSEIAALDGVGPRTAEVLSDERRFTFGPRRRP